MQLNSQLPTLLHIAFAMMTELNLDKERTPPAKTALGGLREFSLVQSPRPETTLEERRTLLGVLWISSTFVYQLLIAVSPPPVSHELTWVLCLGPPRQ